MNSEEWKAQSKMPGTKVYRFNADRSKWEIWTIESTIPKGATVYKETSDGDKERRFFPYQMISTPKHYADWVDKRRKAGITAMKKCLVCGKTFEAMYPEEETCSERCKYKLRAIRTNETKCKRNSKKKGKSIVLEGSVRRKQWGRICVVCGKTFYAHHPTALTCSDTCREKRKYKQCKAHREKEGES